LSGVLVEASGVSNICVIQLSLTLHSTTNICHSVSAAFDNAKERITIGPSLMPILARPTRSLEFRTIRDQKRPGPRAIDLIQYRAWDLIMRRGRFDEALANS